MKYLIWIWWGIGLSVAYGQSPETRPLGWLSPTQLQADWDSLRHIVEQTTPALGAYLDDSTWNAECSRIRVELDSGMDILSFYKLINPLMVRLSDVHTRLWLPRARNPYAIKGGYYLPISFRRIENEVYHIADRDSLIPSGSRLLSFNGLPLRMILDSLQSLVVTDGAIGNTRQRLLEEQFFALYPLYFPLDSVIWVRYQAPEKKRDTVIAYPGLQRKRAPPRQKRIKPRFEDYFHFTLLDSPRVGLMRIGSFSQGGSSRYRRFLRRSFLTLHREGVDFLIIDLRGNRGGYISRGPKLLSYLLDEPYPYIASSVVKASPLFRQKIKKSLKVPGLSIAFFRKWIGKEFVSGWRTPLGQTDTIIYPVYKPQKSKRQFKGKVYLLTDGLSISNSSLVRTAFSDQKLGLVVGTPCGGTANGTFGNSVSFRLPYSGLAGRISTIRINSRPGDFHLQPYALDPDHLVETRLEDFQQQRDTQLEYTLDLIRARQK